VKLSKELMDAVRELVGIIGEDDVQEIEIERGLWGQGKIRIARASSQTPIFHSLPHMPAAPAAPVTQATETSATVSQTPETDESSKYHTLKSPMVGMFYRSPNPEAPSYVQEGDGVTEGQTVCIIEAMKIMNEIEADIKGRVVRVLVENATPVEYNTPLFLIDPQG
jgi:acetyl-CoA carboxylase biotin carboxyl carrier protein